MCNRAAVTNHKLLLFLTTIALFLIGTVSATTFQGEGRFSVTPGDTIDDDALLALNEGTVDGTVTGDLLVACRKFNVTGEIGGSFNCFAQYATVRGTVGGSARIEAQEITVDGKVNGNLIAMGSTIDISYRSEVGKDLTVLGNEISINGNIGRNVVVRGDKVIISGIINGSLNLEAKSISIISPAEINGDIYYKSANEIEIDENAIISGEIEWEEIKPEDKVDTGVSWGFRFIMGLCLFATGLILIPLTKGHMQSATRHIIQRPLVAIGTGFIAFCVTPVAMIFLAVLIVGIPASIILFCIYITFLYISKIYVAVAVGQFILKRLRKNEPGWIWSLLLGILILVLVFAIPVVGMIIYAVVIFAGIGGIILGIKECRITDANSNITL